MLRTAFIVFGYVLMVPWFSRAQVPSVANPEAIVCDETHGCSHRYVDGELFKIIRGPDGVVVTAGLVESRDNKYFRLNVAVVNKSSATFDIIPDVFYIETVGHKPKTLHPISAEAIIQSIERHAEWANFLSALSASLARDTVTTSTSTSTSSSGMVNARSSDGAYASGTYTGSSVGSSTTNTSIPNYAARAEAQQEIERRNASVEAVTAQMMRTALRANTLGPGDGVGGYVYFKSAAADSLKTQIVVAGKIYQFEF